MSIKTWMKEFYPVPASTFNRTEIEKTNKQKTLKAVKHSLKKWQGLTEKNLTKHGCVYNTNIYRVEDSTRTNQFSIDSGSCALCFYFYNICEDCILFKVRGCACDEYKDTEPYTPYAFLTHEGNPNPMIALLKKALKRVQGQIEKSKIKK
jgi:hypothetical protein